MISYINFYWCIEGSGYFRKDDRYCRILPGDVWYMPVGAPHDFYPGEEGFHYYWLALDGESVIAVEQMLQLAPGKKFCGAPPDELFQQILAGLRHLTPERRIEMLGIAFQILFRIAASPVLSESKHEKAPAVEARDLIEREFADPSFNVNRLAELLLRFCFCYRYHTLCQPGGLQGQQDQAEAGKRQFLSAFFHRSFQLQRRGYQRQD